MSKEGPKSAERFRGKEGVAIEDEVRVLVPDQDKLTKDIEDLGGALVFKGTIYDEFFDFREGPTIREMLGGWVRIRTLKHESGKINYEVTFKAEETFNESGGTDRLEANSMIFNTYEEAYTALIETLKSLNIATDSLFVERSSEKERTSLELGEVHIDIDEYKYREIAGEQREDLSFLPVFAEFEVRHDPNSGEETRQLLRRQRDTLIQKLGLEVGPEPIQGDLNNMIDFYKKN